MSSPDEEEVTQPSVVRRVQPVYTQAAMDAGIEGDVRLIGCGASRRPNDIKGADPPWRSYCPRTRSWG